MKLFAKLLIAVLVIAVLLPFTVLKGKDGRPLMSFSDLKVPNMALPKVPDGLKMPEIKSDTGTRKKDVVYKWYDEKGELHFSSTPPPEGIEFTAKGYDPNTNLIQSVKIESESPVITEQEPENKTPSPLSSPYSPEKIEKLFEDAEKVQELLDNRMKQQEALLSQ